MEREVAPLIRRWPVRIIALDGRRYRLFESDAAALICGGIGAEAARRATEAVIQAVHPALVISVGFAGALAANLRPGHVIEPSLVINAADGVRSETGSGEGILVSSATVADTEQKLKLGSAYGALAVDMEAAAVALGARARGVRFGACKAISDALDFSLPTMDDFVAPDGSFHSFRFAVHVAFRPWLWARTVTLARNSAKASRALCAALASILERAESRASSGSMLSGSMSSESNPSDLNPTAVGQPDSEACASALTVGTVRPHTRITAQASKTLRR